MHYVCDRGESKEVKTVLDYVTSSKVEGWIPGDIVLISAPTGSGKSYFVKHTLRNYLIKNSLKCLYLLPRTRIKEQFQQELPNDDTIRFETYQSIATKKSYGNERDQEKYDVVVSDESHYFFSDADYNHATDIAFEWILGQSNAIRVFMSATNDVLAECFDKWRVPYVGYILEADKNPISSLNFFWSEEQLEKLAEQIISSEEKGVFFIQSAEKAHNLYTKYKDKGLFLCSAYNKNFKKYMDEALIDALLENECFDCTLLITTMALDCGVTLRDRAITTIVTDVADPLSIVQCCGRKRPADESDRLDVYILARTNQQINGILRKQRERLKVIGDFIKKGPLEYNTRYERGNDNDRLIFDDSKIDGEKTVFSKRVNQLKHIKIKRDIQMYEAMLQLDGDGYIPYVAKLLGCEEYMILEDEQRIQSLTEYLESIVGNPMLTKADRKPFIEMMDIRRDRKLCKTSGVLAAWLESSGLPYRLHEYRTNRVAEGRRKSYRVWEVVKLAQ